MNRTIVISTGIVLGLILMATASCNSAPKSAVTKKSVNSSGQSANPKAETKTDGSPSSSGAGNESGGPIDPGDPGGPVDGGGNSGGGSNPVVSGPLIATMGIVTSTSLLPTLASITGVSNYRTLPSPILAAYDKYTPALSGSGDAFAMNSAMSGAFIEIVTRFCEAAEARERALPDASRLLFRGINLTNGTPTQVRSMSGSLAQQLTNRFWLGNRTNEELAKIDALIKNLSVTTQDAAGARNLAIAACVTVGASYQTFVQ